MSANVFFVSGFKSTKGFEKQTMWSIEKLRENPSSPSLKVKPLRNAVDPRVRMAKVTDQYRVVPIEFEGSKQRHFPLMRVDNHDEANAYAARPRIRSNSVNGVLDSVVGETGDNEADVAVEIESRTQRLVAERLAKLQAEQEVAVARDESESTEDSEAEASASRTET